MLPLHLLLLLLLWLLPVAVVVTLPAGAPFVAAAAAATATCRTSEDRWQYLPAFSLALEEVHKNYCNPFRCDQ
jgi:hypothetical protein